MAEDELDLTQLVLRIDILSNLIYYKYIKHSKCATVHL